MPRSSLLGLALAGLLAAALALAGCSSGSGGEGGGETATAPTTASAAPPSTVPAVGEALRSFVEAAGSKDVDAMWALLGRGTRARLGPTRDDFARRYGEDFAGGLGTFAGGDYRLVLSVETGSGWGVAAIAGDRVRGGKREYAAYGATLHREDGAWKLVLGEPVRIENVAPVGLTTQERRPAIAARIRANGAIEEAGVWLDGAALPAQVRAADGRDIRVEGTPSQPLAPGWHVIVVFGRTGDVAAAGATPFRVDAADGGGSVA